MPKTTMEEEPDFRLPKETLFPAVLKSVTEREVKYTNRKGEKDTFYKWEWEFEIIEGEYAGLKAWGDTEDRLTTRETNKVRPWAKALMQRDDDFELGEDFDTDSVLGLECVIEVDNVVREKKDGSGDKSYLTPVSEVYPVTVLGEIQSSEPPF